MAKRALSDSDCDDLFSENTKDSCLTPPGSDNCGHHVSRKKRRGIIEKRRRDRINNSLAELRRLVPTAFEKQGSAKLEKAEILQMTVDHLKMLHAKGLDALAYDPHKFAMDYHSIGFRECAAEVGRFLVTCEGMDIQNPVRLRLMSHLQCFAAQRELANKQASASSWGLNPLTPNHSYSMPPSHHSAGGLEAHAPLQPVQHPSLMEASSPSSNHQNYLSSANHTVSPNMPNDLNQGGHMTQHHHQRAGIFPVSAGNHPHSHPSSLMGNPQHNPMSTAPYGMSNHQVNTVGYVQSGKPYRPWGGELVY
ncbi:unnamed protein product [Allacma fusca]|uniref:Hairy/enhancer-of-split related with YRPW motif protein n=1 Tax=Allacma fusca TaxID=39272 RepID=A0A8J2L6X3_9HEXA|nr:unnamed protein product [Allacma fusca]